MRSKRLIDKLLSKIYYGSKSGAFSNVETLYKVTKDANLNLSKKVISDWLNAQKTYLSFKQPSKRGSVPKHISKRRFHTREPYHIISMDTLRLPPIFFSTLHFCLTAVDTFSNYLWCRPIGNITAETVTKAFADILNEMEKKPEKIYTDKVRKYIIFVTMDTKNSLCFRVLSFKNRLDNY